MIKKKAPNPFDDEIDLIKLSKIIYNGKIKIILITIISFLIGLLVINLLPKNYLHSLVIKPSDNIQFYRINSIKKLINSTQKKITNEEILIKFIDDLQDYEEFIFSLQKNIKSLESTSEDQLFKYAKLLKVAEPKKNENNYLINFMWNNTDEARVILKNTINLTLKNLEKKIYEEMYQSLKFEKQNTLSRDRERLVYLFEQTSIAKELNISDNQIDNDNLTQSSLFLNINTADIAYYLRGHRAIDKEIELIKKREYQNFEFIEKEIKSLEMNKIDLIDFNIYLLEAKSLKNNRFILLSSILLGLIVGVFYVLISSAFQSQTVSKKKN